MPSFRQSYSKVGSIWVTSTEHQAEYGIRIINASRSSSVDCGERVYGSSGLR